MKKYRRADELLKEANTIYEKSLELLTKMCIQESLDLEEMSALDNQLKENYAVNLYLTGFNLRQFDLCFWESFLEYKKKAINMYPHRIFNPDGTENSTDNLNTIQSITDKIKSTTGQGLDLSKLGIKDFEISININSALLNNETLLNMITQLDLSNNKIGDQGVKALSKVLVQMPKLKWINLEGNQIGAKGMEAISSPLRQCEDVMLAANNLNEESAQFIANLLRNNNTIESLMLHCNPLAKGITPIVEASKTATKLTFLSWQNIFLFSVEIKPSQQLSNRQLEINTVCDFTQLLQNNDQKLNNLCFGDNGLDFSNTIPFYAALKNNHIIKKLALYKNIINGNLLAGSIENHPSLTSLDLTDTQITPFGIIKLARSVATSEIETLRIGFNNIGCWEEGIGAINLLLKNPKLETLHINNICLDDKGLARIIDSLVDSKIKKIVMSSNKLTNASGDNLRRITDKIVVVEDNDITDHSITNHLEEIQRAIEKKEDLFTRFIRSIQVN